MGEELYERYKNALRQGHVAMLRGRLEDALQAYGEAADIAPDRAVPHTGLAGVLFRLDRLDEAMAEYAEALDRSPRDEGALLGQAEALAAAGRRPEAAVALDRVAEVQEAEGLVPEACDTLRRALELDPSPERGRRQRTLLRELRLSVGDQAAEAALGKALRLREPEDAAELDVASTPRTVEVEGAASVEPAAAEVLADASVGERGGGSADVDEHGPAAAGDAAEAPGLAAPPAAVVAADEEAPSAETAPSAGPSPDPAALAAAAEAADLAGDGPMAADRWLAAAQAYGRSGLGDAALDAALRALALAPAGPDPQLVLVRLYLDRGWLPLAVEKLRLLARLVELTGDSAARDRLCALIAELDPGEPALEAVCR